MIAYPAWSPVAFSVGPFHVYWYGIMYVCAFLAAWRLAVYRIRVYQLPWSLADLDDFIFDAAIGVIIGGRLGYMLFYSQGQWWHDPLTIIRVWEGGMSFHGGLCGVAVALAIFAKKQKRSFLSVADFAAPLAPLGLALGRFGNFINGELWGRVTQVPWAMVFPHGGERPRHPSQLYELGLEGIVLFIVVWLYASKPRLPGQVSGVFLVGYALSRLFVEFFRQPDPQLGYLMLGWVTMGHLLSLPLLFMGLYLLGRRP